MKNKKIYVFVTNDLNQDQRMRKICLFFQKNDYQVVLIGRQKKNSPGIIPQPYKQVRFSCLFERGPLFYAEYNLRMILFLLLKKEGIIYSVDLDTLTGASFVSFWTRRPVIFDAHEWFTETPEVENRKWVKKIWSHVASWGIPGVKLALTVNSSLADIFSRQYGINFTPVYNVPPQQSFPVNSLKTKLPFQLLYQGVLNTGRGLEEIISAMEKIPHAVLTIVGEGDLSQSLRMLAKNSSACDRIYFAGWLFGEALTQTTAKAHLGLNLLSSESKSYHYSLANKFFDYMHAGVPSLNMDFPEYSQIIEKYPIGWTISQLNPEDLSNAINHIFENQEEYERRKKACFQAQLNFNWEKEEEKLKDALTAAGLL